MVNSNMLNTPIQHPVDLLIPYLPVYRYKISIKVLQSGMLPTFLGASLHGAMGHWLLNLKCKRSNPYSKLCADNCICDYSRMMLNVLSNNKENKNSRFQNPPNPYIIDAFTTSPVYINSGGEFSFYFSLIGNANKYLHDYIMAIAMSGIEGLGNPKNRKKYILQTVQHIKADGSYNEIYNAQHNNLNTLVKYSQYKAATKNEIARSATSSKQMLHLNKQIELEPHVLNNTYTHQSPTNPYATLHFKSPLRIISQKKVVDNARALSFDLLYRFLYNRAAMLAHLYANAPEPSLLTASNFQVADVYHNYKYFKYHPMRHYSSKKQHYEPMGGLLGSISFGGNVAPYLPLLQFGQYIHIGKATPFGLGKYELS